MLERNRTLRHSAKSFSEKITLAPEESKQSRFKTWLAEKLSTPHFCSEHPRAQLVFEPGEGGIGKVYDEERRYGDPLKEIPGVFDFHAALRCPSCRCAYALCPSEFHPTGFETFQTSTSERADALSSCREFAAQVNKHECGFALLVGGTGNGKTRLASNVVGALENSDALYVRQGQLTIALRATYRPWPKEYDREGRLIEEPKHPLEITQGVRFLVLDEIGCAPLANDERLLLDELLKHRYDERKPTILISNLPLDQFKDFLGDALTDRIRTAAGNGKFILQFSGESFRPTFGEKYFEGLE